MLNGYSGSSAIRSRLGTSTLSQRGNPSAQLFAVKVMISIPDDAEVASNVVIASFDASGDQEGMYSLNVS